MATITDSTRSHAARSRSYEVVQYVCPLLADRASRALRIENKGILMVDGRNEQQPVQVLPVDKAHCLHHLHVRGGCSQRYRDHRIHDRGERYSVLRAVSIYKEEANMMCRESTTCAASGGVTSLWNTRLLVIDTERGCTYIGQWDSASTVLCNWAANTQNEVMCAVVMISGAEGRRLNIITSVSVIRHIANTFPSPFSRT